MKNNPLITGAEEFIFNLFKEKLSAEYTYHSYQHTLETVKACKKLAKPYNLTARDHEVLLLAAWFHDAGYTEAYTGHEEKSVEIVKNYLKDEYTDGDLAEIESLIMSTKADAIPDGTLQEILHDADLINMGKKKFEQRSEMLRIEWERLMDRKYTDLEWARGQLDFLLSCSFKTEEAVLTLNPQREMNIQAQREKILELEAGEAKKQDKLEKGNAPKKEGRGVETLYRAVYDYHISLSSMADSKANIMISVNTIIMSIIITLFGSGYTFSNEDQFASVRFVFPIALLLLTSLTAVVFAILSSRPNITSKEKFELNNKQSSVLFFGNFAQLQLKEFVERIKELKAEREDLYESMSVDIYHLGGVLVKKYRLLTWSYNVFMGGLVLTAVGFIIIIMASYN